MIEFGTGNNKGKFSLAKNDTLNENIFDQYIKENGIEKAAGYLEASRDICQHLKDILGNFTGDGQAFSAHTVKTNTKLLWQHLNNFIVNNEGTNNLNIDRKPDQP